MPNGVALRQDYLVLGRYRALRPLGAGGSGSVWLAVDERSGREVALKVVPREGKSGARAEREVEAASRLRHQRCLRAYALERDAENVYVAYEYVAGRTFRQALRAGDLDDATAVEASAQVLEGLAHAHARGVIHRDIKPANVMLEESSTSPSGPGGQGVGRRDLGAERRSTASAVSVRILDFGLAQLNEADTLTAAGDVPGTLAYIAPERLAGREADGAADVWAVGLMLWEALAGYHPFWAASPVETARKIGAGAPPLAKPRPDLPDELCALVDRMLDLEPKRRPSPNRLAEALREAADPRARRPRPAASRRVLLERAPHAALAAAYTAFGTLLLPFYPVHGAPLLAAAAGLAAFVRPGAGLALALAVPVLPLGNVSLGLAVVYALLALAWLASFARDPANGLLPVAGALLVPFVPGLVPLVAARARGPARRAAVAAMSVLLATAVAGAAAKSLPLTGEPAPLGLGIGGSERPTAVAHALLSFLAAHPALPLGAAALGLAAVALPYARSRALWGIAGWSAAALALLLLPAAAAGDRVSSGTAALGIWLAAAALAAGALRPRR